MDLALVMPWVGAALSIIALLTQAKAFFSSGERALDARLAKAEKALVDHDRRIQSVEGEMKHLPDREQAHRLELAMEKISGRLDALDERLKPVIATNERLQELLMEQARK